MWRFEPPHRVGLATLRLSALRSYFFLFLLFSFPFLFVIFFRYNFFPFYDNLLKYFYFPSTCFFTFIEFGKAVISISQFPITHTYIHTYIYNIFKIILFPLFTDYWYAIRHKLNDFENVLSEEDNKAMVKLYFLQHQKGNIGQTIMTK